MTNHKKQNPWKGLVSVVSLFGTVAVFLLAAAISGGLWIPGSPKATGQVAQPQPSPTVDCPDDLSNLHNDPTFRYCAEERMLQIAQEEEYLRQTAEAEPTPPQVNAITHLEPAVVPQSADEKKIEELPLMTKLGAPDEWRDANNIWLNGTVASRKTIWEPLYLLAKPGTNGFAILQTITFNGSDDVKDEQAWTAPVATGDLHITNATGPGGVISFTSTSGKSGTLDTSSGEWVIDGVIYPSTPGNLSLEPSAYPAP